MTNTPTPGRRALRFEAWKAEHPNYVELAAKYGDLLVNTGGNDPLELVADLDLDKNMMTTNVVRFVLAVGVQSQLLVLSKTGTREEGHATQEQLLEAASKALQDGGAAFGMDESAARRMWHYLYEPMDPQEGLIREVECCPGKTCRTRVVRRAGQWIRWSNGERWFEPGGQL